MSRRLLSIALAVLVVAVAFPATAGIQVEPHHAGGFSAFVEGLMGHVLGFLGLDADPAEEPPPAIPPEDGTVTTGLEDEPSAELAPEMDPNG